MSVTHNIELDNAQNKYYSGETLSGRVNLAVHGSEPAVLEGKDISYIMIMKHAALDYMCSLVDSS